VAFVVAADWPQYRGPNRDDVSKETGLLKEWPKGGPTVLWTYDNAGVGYSPVSVVGDRVYITGGRDDKEQAERQLHCATVRPWRHARSRLTTRRSATPARA